MKTILVEIAAYRDNELPLTVESCLKAADHPELLRFAIYHQYGPESEHLLKTFKSDGRFRLQQCRWQESGGVGRARRACDDMYQGEDFYLQIDAHTRFEPGWDTRLLMEWQRAAHSRAILTSYPPAYRYDDNDTEVYIASEPNRLVVHDFFMDRIPVFYGKALSPGSTRSLQGAFCAGGFQFGPGQRCIEVPYEPRVVFIGEEVVHSLRLFAADYALFSPLDQPLSHLYIRSQHQKNAYHFWQDFQNDAELKAEYDMLTLRSYRVVESYLAGEAAVSVETVRRFECFAGVDFTSHNVHPHQIHTPTLPVVGPSEDDSWRNYTVKPQKLG
jgi:glycosyltransferase involved in cell wall biosynthesis